MKRMVACFVAAMIIAGFGEAAEKRTFTFTECDKFSQTLSANTLTPNDVPGHQLTTRVERKNFSTTDPEYGETDTITYGFSDDVNGTGTHQGIAADKLKNGETIYWKYQGKHQTVTREGGAWETSFEGTGVIVAGTGKYKTAKGTERYRGKITAEGCASKGDAQWEY